MFMLIKYKFDKDDDKIIGTIIRTQLLRKKVFFE